MSVIRNFVLLFVLVLTSCQDLVDDINENPNEPTNVRPELLLKGMELANITIQVSHVQRISGMWSGQYIGSEQLYQSLYEYNINAAETNDTWEAIYVGVLKQGSLIKEGLPEDRLFQGITKIIEAHAVGTAAAIFGDIPYFQAANDEQFPDPEFDGQRQVYDALQDLLDEAIIDLQNAAPGRELDEDIFFQGNAEQWTEVAYTLKARYHLHTKQYDLAYAAAQNGVSSGANSMKYVPLGVVGEGDSNLLNTFISNRGDFMTSSGSFLEGMLDVTSGASRNNTKTYEEARANYYYIEGGRATGEQGVAAQTAPMPLVLYEENLLILAEAAARTVSFDEGLVHLNAIRNFLNSGTAFPLIEDSDSLLYEAYEAADFEPGGLENTGNIDPTRALLREIIEERYVTGYGQFIPFNDARRLRRSDQDIAVPIPLNTPEATQQPERFLIAQDEINANSNADDPGIFAVTPVNQ